MASLFYLSFEATYFRVTSVPILYSSNRLTLTPHLTTLVAFLSPASLPSKLLRNPWSETQRNLLFLVNCSTNFGPFAVICTEKLTLNKVFSQFYARRLVPVSSQIVISRMLKIMLEFRYVYPSHSFSLLQ